MDIEVGCHYMVPILGQQINDILVKEVFDGVRLKQLTHLDSKHNIG